ncbi:GNAT family N-acetyltransferase [Leuconostoc mesenteroides]|uniref:GNAT family N-acetyltransferase n=1 Tax=Leuconostoc mesenteroides TaxID=1245 RepID=UPI003B8F661B
MSIRKVSINDLADILRIEQLSFTPEKAGAEVQYVKRIKELNDAFLVTVIDIQVVGFIVGPDVHEKTISGWMYEEIQLQGIVGGNQIVLMIAVDSSFQDYHVGSRLLNSLFEIAEKKQYRIDCSYLFTKNITFYEKMAL